MQITRKERFARALRDTVGLHDWSRRFVEWVLTTGLTFAVIKYAESQPAAVTHMTAVIVAAIVALFIVPFIELAINYAKAPLAIENDALRAQLDVGSDAMAPPPPSAFHNRSIVAPSTEPPRMYVREATGGAVLARYINLGWKERNAVFDAAYRGRWIRGRGAIGSMTARESGDVFLSLRDDGLHNSWGFLVVRAGDRHRIEHLDTDDTVDYEVRIDGASGGVLDLSEGEFHLIKKHDT